MDWSKRKTKTIQDTVLVREKTWLGCLFSIRQIWQSGNVIRWFGKQKLLVCWPVPKLVLQVHIVLSSGYQNESDIYLYIYIVVSYIYTLLYHIFINIVISINIIVIGVIVFVIGIIVTVIIIGMFIIILIIIMNILFWLCLLSSWYY